MVETNLKRKGNKMFVCTYVIMGCIVIALIIQLCCAKFSVELMLLMLLALIVSSALSNFSVLGLTFN